MIIVAPVVEVEASQIEVAIGHSVTLHCSVIRTNPEVIMFTWVHENSSTLLQSNNVNNTTITVTVMTKHHLGTIFCIAINAAGRMGNASLTLELGCKHNFSALNYDINNCNHDNRLSLFILFLQLQKRPRQTRLIMCHLVQMCLLLLV